MPLPHALESLLSILVAVQQDNASGIHPRSSSLSLRQSYATALIRLVNGLVDPLQAGTYARSILSIATQIGLPVWLVELRHAATHEDLPSLELLRDGVKEVSPPSYTNTKEKRMIRFNPPPPVFSRRTSSRSPSVGSCKTTFSLHCTRASSRRQLRRPLRRRQRRPVRWGRC
jgi:ribosomal biogenesis protein LAS1